VTGLVAQAALIFALGCTGYQERLAVRYDPDLMEGIARARGLPITPCLFAHPTLPLGTRARILGVRTGHAEWCDQADTSEDVDRARHIRLRRIELSYAASLRICGAQWGGAAVECPVRVWVIPNE
jgi:hypothetical protein